MPNPRILDCPRGCRRLTISATIYACEHGAVTETGAPVRVDVQEDVDYFVSKAGGWDAIRRRADRPKSKVALEGRNPLRYR